jgi:D-amino-acid oxidase
MTTGDAIGARAPEPAEARPADARAAHGAVRAVDRRTALRRLATAAVGLAVPGCAGSGRDARRFRPQAARPLAPVRVARDRVLRAVAGLRPFRPSGFVIRAERAGDKLLIHNYGHGGGGITLSWGCAEQAARLTDGVEADAAAVVGCGVMGLSTARLLQDRGRAVTIYTRELPAATTSAIAGGQWAPFSVSDPDRTTPQFAQRFEEAARIAHRAFQSMVGPRYGVRWIENYVLRDAPPAGPRPLADLYPAAEELPPGTHPFAARSVGRFTTLLIEPHVYLEALLHDFLLRGGRLALRGFETRESILTLEENVIMNCTGLGSRALFGDDELVPVRGQLVLLLPQPEVDYIVLRSGTYMFPRSDAIVLGGTQEHGEWSTEPDAATTDRILAAHRALFAGRRGGGGGA